MGGFGFMSLSFSFIPVAQDALHSFLFLPKTPTFPIYMLVGSTLDHTSYICGLFLSGGKPQKLKGGRRIIPLIFSIVDHYYACWSPCIFSNVKITCSLKDDTFMFSCVKRGPGQSLLVPWCTLLPIIKSWLGVLFPGFSND